MWLFSGKLLVCRIVFLVFVGGWLVVVVLRFVVVVVVVCWVLLCCCIICIEGGFDLWV